MDAEFGPAALAIIAGDLDRLAAMLVDDPELATRESSVGHPTLLQFIACEEPHVADPVGAARLLIDAGSPTLYPLISAAGCDAEATLGFFLDSGIGPNLELGANGGWTPLDEALYWNNDNMAKLLLDHGAELRSVRNPAGLGDVEGLARFFGDDGALTPDAGPLASPFPKTVPDHLANDPQSLIDHAFVLAVNNGHRDAAAELLRRGAQVNAKPPGYHWHGTALHAACWRGDQALVEWLLASGADPSISDDMDGVNADAAGWARHHGHEHLIQLLS